MVIKLFICLCLWGGVVDDSYFTTSDKTGVNTSVIKPGVLEFAPIVCILDGKEYPTINDETSTTGSKAKTILYYLDYDTG